MGKSPWGRTRQPTPVFLPRESYGQRSLAGYSPWGLKESDTSETTERTRCINTQWTITQPQKKKKQIMPLAATWMDLEIIIPSEVSQRKTNTIWYHLHVESSKMIHMNLYTKQKQAHRRRKQTYSYQRGKRG